MTDEQDTIPDEDGLERRFPPFEHMNAQQIAHHAMFCVAYEEYATPDTPDEEGLRKLFPSFQQMVIECARGIIAVELPHHEFESWFRVSNPRKWSSSTINCIFAYLNSFTAPDVQYEDVGLLFSCVAAHECLEACTIDDMVYHIMSFV